MRAFVSHEFSVLSRQINFCPGSSWTGHAVYSLEFEELFLDDQERDLWRGVGRGAVR